MTFFDDKAYTINDLIAAVIAIETELGPLPAGVYASVRTRLDILEARINNPFAPAPNVNNPFYIGGSPVSGVSIQTGFGDPNSELIPAISGSLFLREDGYNNQGLYSFRPDGYWHQIDTDPWTACGDLAGTIYCQTVIGLQNHAINPDASLLQTDSEGDGYVLTWNATANGGHGWWEPQIGFFAAGDLAGNKINQTVVNLQGHKLSVANPQDGYVLTWDGVLSQWDPQPPAVIFDPKDNSSVTNIRGNRASTQSPIDNTQLGIVNLGSDTSQLTLGARSNYSTILGGDQNEVTGTYGAIVGGLLNVVNGTQGFVGSGNSNIAGSSSAVITGTGNFASGTQFSYVGTGNVNLITGGIFSTVENGQMNNITTSFSTILNGSDNSINGSGNYATILGGNTNAIFTTPLGNNYNLIGQGVDGYISDQASFATIINGNGNQILAAAGAVVSGNNNFSSSPFTLIQGENNTVGAKGKFVNIVGDFNTSGTTATNSHYSAVWGCGNSVQDGYIAMFGLHNTMNTGSTFADIHGDVNVVSSDYTSIWGSQNTIGTGDGYVSIFGDHNTIGNSSIYSYVWGTTNTVSANSPDSWVIGSNNTVITGSSFGYAWGQNNQVSGIYPSAWGQSNTVSQLISGYSSAWGQSNTVAGDFSSAWGSRNNVTGYWNNAWGQYNSIPNNVYYSNVFGYYGQARLGAQFVQAGNTPNGSAGAEQYSRVILDGNAVSGGTFNLNVAYTGTPVTLEDGKAYDMTIRVLITQTTGTPGVAANFVFDILAHQESGTAVLDSVNATLSDPNGTGWSVAVSTSGNQLVINVPALGSTTRRAVATVEWRELSRM